MSSSSHVRLVNTLILLIPFNLFKLEQFNLLSRCFVIDNLSVWGQTVKESEVCYIIPGKCFFSGVKSKICILANPVQLGFEFHSNFLFVWDFGRRSNETGNQGKSLNVKILGLVSF